MASLTVTAVLSLVALLAFAESAPREKRQVGQYPVYGQQQQQYPTFGQQQQQQQLYPGQQGGYQCPQSDGQFAYDQDCTMFYQCDSGVATLTDCQPQLVFNSQAGYCDWPANVPGCQPNNQQMIKSEIGNICSSNPAAGSSGTSATFHVAHHMYCNAFFTCSTSYLFPQCTFCPEGAYFNALAGGCRPIPAGIIDPSPFCNGKQYVRHQEKPALTLGDACWPWANRVNPWQALIDSPRFNPNPNPGYNPNPNPRFNPNPNQGQYAYQP